jgi:hypothetical protein
MTPGVPAGCVPARISAASEDPAAPLGHRASTGCLRSRPDACRQRDLNPRETVPPAGPRGPGGW